ncbi:AsmA family protein [Halomonas sp. ZH2S]|uniref:AsmA family protein n=1 Tax=Vreelandella zhuhanensis TaxID=2684210 RepID=A0A7X3H159_9GAMM|nr:AsmA family protein [Halomonas zhuhanensis]MWJ28638.1 AsmA family protein [Halomonas zhuhanensis]
MKRLLRILLAAVGMLAIVAVGAVVYVTTFLDPEDFKPRLTAVVQEHTGLELALEGPLSWSFYPRIGVSVENAQAWLPEQENDEEAFAAINRAEVSLAFAPLLRGEIAVDGLTLEGLRLNLERDAEGEGNWEPLIERLAESEEDAETVLAPASAGPNTDAGNLTVVLNIASVEVRKADIRFRDEMTNRLLHFQQVNISGSNVNPVRAFPLKAMFTLTSHNRLDAEKLERSPDLTTEVNLETRLKLALDERRYVLENTTLTTRSRRQEESEVQQVDFRAAEIVANLSSQQLSVREGNIEASLRHPENWQGALTLSLAYGLEGDWQAETARLKNLQLTGPDGLRLSGHLNLEEVRQAPRYHGQLNMAPFNLRPWLKRAGIELKTANEAALSDVALTSPIEGDMQQLAFSGLSLVVDNGTYIGRLEVGLEGERLAFDLEGDELNLDSYLPPTNDNSQASRVVGVSTAHANTPSNPSELLPQRWLSGLTLEGALSIDQLMLGGLDFAQTELAMDGEPGLHRLSAFNADFYGGQLSATGRLDSRETILQWALQPNVSRVQVDALLEALSEGASPIRGRVELEGDLTSRGNTRDSLVRHLNGTIDARLSDGAILDINVSQELCELVAQLEGEGTAREWHSDTRFERFDATFDVSNGLIQSKDLSIALPGIQVQGEGEFDLNSLRFDARANTRIVDTADAACRVSPQLERLTLPVRCEGHVNEARDQWCRFDRNAFQDSLTELLRAEAGERINEEVEGRMDDALERLDENLGEGAAEEIRDGLRRLFN